MIDESNDNIDIFRDQYFQIISDMTENEKFNWVKEKLSNEQNEIKRLALMAVRVSILRSRKIGQKEKIIAKPKKQKNDIPKINV